MTKSELPHGVRMKGGVAFDEELDGFVAIIHSWDNVDCYGEPEEWRSARVFQTEQKAMRYYKTKIRPHLKKAARKAARQVGGSLEERKLE